MTEKKMTKKDWFEVIKTVVENSEVERKEDVLSFINHEIELLSNRTVKSGMTKTQKENVNVCAEIREAFAEVAKPVTITELMNAVPSLKVYSFQKISALIRQMKNSGEVVRTEIKNKAFFSLAENE